MIDKIRNIPMIWWILTIFTFIEFYFFRVYIVENIAFFYPINFDQSNYLTLSYSTFENIKQYGLVAGIQKTPGLATGMLFPIQAIFFYLVFGASRFISLLPNFIYFILLQVFSLIAVRSISKKHYISLICLAFIISLNVPFRVSGGLMDFRMDFIAFCLYGMVLASAVKSKIFLDIKWSVITVLLVIFLILLRFITSIYMLSIFWPLVFYFLFIINTSKPDAIGLKENKIRLKNLTLMTVFLTGIVLLYVLINREVLYNYYMVGHLLGSEKFIRAKELGVTNLLSSISFYPKSIYNDQLGRFWFKLSLISLLFPFIFLKIKPHIKSRDSKDLIPWRAGFFFFLLSLLVPLIILTLDVSKSRVVGSIMVMPVIWLIMWFYLYLDRKLKENNPLLTIMGVFILLISFSHQLIKFQHKNILQLNDLKKITTMYLAIGDYANAHNWPSINLSVDQVCDYLSSGGIETIYYEIRGKILPVGIQQAGGSIFSIKKSELISSLKNSNVLIMNLNEYPDDSTLPFNQSIRGLRPLMKEYASLYFHRIGDYKFMNSTYRVFVKSTR